MHIFSKLTLASFVIFSLFGGEKYPNQGEGIVGVVITSTPGRSEVYDSSTVIKRYRYYIKGYKILKSDTELFIQTTNSSNTKMPKVSDNDAAVVVTGGVKTIQTTYLIDLNKLLTYTYFKKDNKLYVAIDSLSRHFEDNYYRNLGTPFDCTIQYSIDRKIEIIAGKPCLTATAITSTKDTFFLKYTEQTTKVSSPLNCLFPQCEYSIFSIDLPVQSKGQISEQWHMRIDYFKETRLDDKMFHFLPNDGFRKNVPKGDVLKGANID